jgi:hypothetical protein
VAPVQQSKVSTRRLAMAVASGGVAVGGLGAVAAPAYAAHHRIYWSACAAPGKDHGNSLVNYSYGPNEAQAQFSGLCSGTGKAAACVQPYVDTPFSSGYGKLKCSTGTGNELVISGPYRVPPGEVYYANARICHSCNAGTINRDHWLWAYS